jgi:RNA recognition motif-containing protein
MTETQLYELCGRFGQVSKVQIADSQYSGQSRGFGFVEMATENDATACMTGLNSATDLAQKLTVSASTSNPFKKSKRS